VHEADETFTVDLSSPLGATVADGQGVGTIENDDDVPTFAVDDVSRAEGDSGTTAFTFTVTKTGATSLPAGVDFATANGTASAPGDYAGGGGTLSFAAGEMSKQATVLVNGDGIYEADETFFVNLSDPSGATISDAQGAGTIVNDDGAPVLTIDDVSRTEGSVGHTAFTFTVTKSGATELPASFEFATANGTATAPGDFVADVGTRELAPDETEQRVTILVVGDTTFEADETLFLNLSSPSGATLGDNQGQGTIENDDAAPTLAIDDVGKAEGNSGTTAFTFTVTKTGATELPASVDVATANGTASVPGDYAAGNAALAFAPGEATKTMTVQVNGDATFEVDETFFVDLSNASGATITDGQGLGTIENDDAAPTLSIGDVSKAEGDSGLTEFFFTVTKTGATELPASVAFATADGTATQPDDYWPYAGTLTFAPADTSWTLSVLVNGDATDEPDETFFMNLTSPTGATIADGQGLGTIVNDDGNNAPNAVDDSATTNEDTAVDVDVLANDTDADGDVLTITSFGQGTKGTVTLVAGKLRYDPNDDVNGTDAFTYTISDGSETDTATVTVTVLPVNDAPVAQSQTVSTPEDTPKAITLGVTDVDGPAPTFAIVSGPAHGTLSGTGATRTYTPVENYTGPDSFTFRANDGSLDSNVATVSITVTPVNDAPLAADDEYSTNEDVPFGIGAPGVLADDTDVEGSPLSAALVAGPAHGTLTLNANGSFGYAPAANFNGVDTFTYRASDGSLSSNVATVTITVLPVNDAPAAANDAYAVDAGATLSVAAPGVLTNDSDLESAVTAVLVTGPANGTLTLSPSGSFTYTPNAGFSGSDPFTYRARDGAGAESAPATVTIEVRPVTGGEPPPPGSPCTISGTPQAETLTGTPGDDVICAFGGNDTIDGAGGNDLIDAGTGNDRVSGGVGNDHIRGGVGDDTINGNSGNDEVEAGNGDDVVDGGDGNDQLGGDGGADTLAGGDGEDVLEGSAGADEITGGAGDDRADGGTSNDTVDGGAGNDNLRGGAGADELFGRAGADVLNGDAGPDLLDGGADQDSCTNGEIYVSCNETSRGAAGPAAASVQAGTFASSFTSADQAVSRTLSLPASTPGVTALLTWDNPAASFAVEVELVSGKTVAARGLAMRSAKPVKLRLKVTRGAGYMSVQALTPANVQLQKKPLKLRLKVRAKKVKGKTRVTTRVLRQKPRR
jgi:VCBS repeat-containing protein